MRAVESVGLPRESRAVAKCYVHDLNRKSFNTRMLHNIHGRLAGPASSMHGADTRARSQISNNTTPVISIPCAINVSPPPNCPHTAPIPPGLLQSAPGRTKEEGGMKNAESRGRLCPAMRENHALPRAIPKPPQGHINATSRPVDSQLIATPMRPQCVYKAPTMRLQSLGKAKVEGGDRRSECRKAGESVVFLEGLDAVAAPAQGGDAQGGGFGAA